MSHPAPTACPRCDAPIPARAADQLCPACLLVGALEHGAEPEGLDSDFPRPFGGYRLLSLLGRGGMGRVYEAEQLATGRRLALKVLGRELDSPEMRQRFLQEGRLAAGVNHPNCLYVFGAEEVEGRPVITMEIAAGGTLKDRLAERGPLPVQQAVDAMLDVIRGLEALAVSGVLHRDIKPSNCFVTSDGTVKIGDFGLSVSTVVRDDPHAPGDGTGMGTPAFASPEQLLGRELDLRADIYSVGATLFALLTGTPPVGGRGRAGVRTKDSAAEDIVAEALERTPEPLTRWRDDVPPELAKVVARCLAKKPEHRPPDYEALRRALQPFGSDRPKPAPLGPRLFAGFIDIAICGILPAIAIHAALGIDIDDRTLFTERSTTQLVAWVGLSAWFVVYFTFFEGIFHAAVGKVLMGLRVEQSDGRAQGVGRALLRNGLFILGGNLGKGICYAVVTAEDYASGGATLVSIVVPLVGILPFATMRRRNGWATVWDLATRTRVVTRADGTSRPEISVTARPESSPGESIGPYTIEDAIVPSRWLRAQDPVLRRPVWLLRREHPVGPARREVARPGRNRWLQEVATPVGRWDAFAAPDGTALSDLARSGDGLAWESLRHWLHDLASELAAAQRDGTLPTRSSRDHIWITAEGRAVLLDEPWPHVDRIAEVLPVSELAGQQRFLHEIASHADAVTIPRYARPVLQSLAEGSFERLSFLVGSLRTLLDKRTRIDSRFRAVSLLASPSVLLVAVSMLANEAEIADRQSSTAEGHSWIRLVAVLTLVALGACSALPQLVTLLTLRTTLGQAVFGIATVDACGEPAGRGRLFARWLLAWSLPASAFVLFTSTGNTTSSLVDMAAWILLALWLLGIALAIVRPAQGPHDRWSGCWLVPR